jgi:hypothetical protein
MAGAAAVAPAVPLPAHTLVMRGRTVGKSSELLGFYCYEKLGIAYKTTEAIKHAEFKV